MPFSWSMNLINTSAVASASPRARCLSFMQTLKYSATPSRELLFKLRNFLDMAQVSNTLLDRAPRPRTARFLGASGFHVGKFAAFAAEGIISSPPK